MYGYDACGDMASGRLCYASLSQVAGTNTNLTATAAGSVTARFVNSSTLLPFATNQNSPPPCTSYSANQVSSALICTQALRIQFLYNNACGITGMHGPNEHN
jgi:hypothetical protein